MIESTSTTDSFLDGQGIPVDLPHIETELAKLWGPAAEQIGGPELENPNVTRIVLANLVVVCLDGDCESLGPVLETVIARFPCRAIVVRGSDDPERHINAEVSALCHLPAPGLPQVCSERILLRAGPQAIDLVPGAVRPLLEADLPMVLWWTSDPRKHEHLFRDLADECARLILDLPDPGADVGALRLGLDAGLSPSGRDSTWFGLARWRELVAQFFDPPCNPNSLKRICSINIEVLSPDPSRPPRIASWLAAWLAGQLGWEPQGKPVNATSGGASVLIARLLGPAGDIAVTITTQPLPAGLPASPRLMGVTITTKTPDGPETFRLSRPAPESPAVRVDARAFASCCLPRVIEAPELDPARRIAAALESSRLDPPCQKALPIALWLMEYERS
jgi:Glucose-6-phosphate dehydrogenase subunit N-terminal domain/Glucose-6-phosphate dehydrogenase subunit C-terminal domain